MVKVLHVSHSLDTGGGPLYIKKLIEDIPTIDHFVTGNKGYFLTLFETMIGKEKTYSLARKNVLKNIRIIKKICTDNNITIIHCHGRGAALYTRLVKLFYPQARIIYTVHGFHPGTLHAVKRFFYVLSERIFLPLTWRVINVSLSENKLFIEKTDPSNREKIVYIPNYIKDSDIRTSPSPVTLDRRYINLLYIGRLSPEKGIDLLVEAWKTIAKNDIRLYVVGYGPLENILKDNFANDIIYLGKIENAGTIMSNFDGLIIPSRFEGMPFVGLEAMISKTPVISTPAAGLVDLFNDDNSYQAKNFSRASICDTIHTFIDDFKYRPDMIQRKVDNGYQRVRGEFSSINVERITELYSQR